MFGRATIRLGIGPHSSMVMDFSAVEKRQRRETLRACSTTIQTGLLPFWCTLA